MYSLLYDLRTNFQRENVITDNVIFRIHCTFTSVLLIIFSLIITYTQFVGQPIRCVPEKDNGPPQYLINLYCWTTTTFIVPAESVVDQFNRPSSEIFYGIGPSPYNSQDYKSSHHKYFTYYQWTWFVLLLQAMFFYLPKWLWSNWEQGLLKTMVNGMQGGFIAEEETERQKKVLVEYLRDNTTTCKWYTYKYWFCECLCLVNVLCQMFVMNWFFKGDFLNYGYEVLFLEDRTLENRDDHILKVFPRMSKCTYKNFGHSGSIQQLDSLCILPLNIVNEKIYIFLWFWFIVLLLLTVGLLVWRVLQILVKRCRQLVMLTRYRAINEHHIETIVNKTTIGTWWIIYLLGRNIDSHTFITVVKKYVDLADQIDKAD